MLLLKLLSETYNFSVVFVMNCSWRKVCFLFLKAGLCTPTLVLPWQKLNVRIPGLTASALVSDVSAPACTNGERPPLRRACECGAEEQTVDHVVFQCRIHRPPDGLHGLAVLDEETIEWLLNTSPRSSAVKQWFQQLAQKKRLHETKRRQNAIHKQHKGVKRKTNLQNECCILSHYRIRLTTCQ